jgi:hypothetical protein
MYKFELNHYMLYLQGEKVCICGLSEVFSKSQKDWVRKSQIRKVSHLRKVRKSNNLFKSINLRICDFRKLFAVRLPLQ